MVASVSPLEVPLQFLRDSAASEVDTAGYRLEDLVKNLRRIKHALIGNLSRKLELAGRADDVKRCA